jgi:hypothetical protein
MTASRPSRASKNLRTRIRAAATAFARTAARRERLWIGIALAATGLLLGVFAAIHIVLASSLLRGWVNSSPDELLLGYDSASSWVPGVVRVRGLTMRGSDPNVQWYFRMEDATISISLGDLLRKRFHATSVLAHGLVFRLREKEEKGELSPALVARLPEIPGFADPPLKIDQPVPPPLPPGAGRRYWSVLIEDLVADPTPELWIEIYRFRGHARVTGGFLLRPHTEVRVGPAAVQFLSGDLALAPDQPLLSAFSGSSDCMIKHHDPERVIGDQIWRYISGNIRLNGRLTDLRFLNYFLRHSTEPRLEGGEGTAQAALRFVDGIGQGRAEFEASRLTTRYAKGTLRGRASGRLEIPHWDVERHDMEISGSRVNLADIVTAGTSHDERDWWGRFDILSGRLHNGLAARTSIHCRDARPLFTLFNANLPGWAQGILKLEGLEARARVRFAKDLVDVQDLDATGGKFHIAGQYRDRGRSRQGAFLIETGLLAVGLEIDGPSSHVKLLGARDWFRRATAKGAPEPAAAAR